MCRVYLELAGLDSSDRLQLFRHMPVSHLCVLEGLAAEAECILCVRLLLAEIEAVDVTKSEVIVSACMNRASVVMLSMQKVSCMSKVGMFADVVVCGSPDISLGRFE